MGIFDEAKKIEKIKIRKAVKESLKVQENKNSDYEVAIMELRKDIDYLKKGQDDLKETLIDFKDEILQELRENYVNKASCNAIHLGNVIKQGEKGNKLRDKIIWSVFGLISAVVGGVAVYFLTH